jgi:hypothetical protein
MTTALDYIAAADAAGVLIRRAGGAWVWVAQRQGRVVRGTAGSLSAAARQAVEALRLNATGAASCPP